MDQQAANSALYGKGVFTTIAMRRGEPLLWEKHWRRLMRDAEKIGTPLAGHTERSTKSALDEHRITDGRARITFYDESPAELWAVAGEKRATLSIVAAPPREIPEPFRLTTSPYPINSKSPLAGVKSCNYLENILAKEEAADRSFSEAIRVNEQGKIASGCMANVFWMNDGRLFTPSLTTGCLAGTTREYILENLDCDEGEFEISDLRRAEAIFLTSAGIGVAPVAEFEERALNTADHPILNLFPK